MPRSTLGVRVEVEPVTASAVRRDTIEAARSRAALDHRTSLANIVRRVNAGEVARTCGHCGTETDVEKPAHDPKCDSYITAVKLPDASAGPGEPSWEKGRNGQRRSTRERNAAGELSGGEMQRRHEVVLDGLPTVTSCAIAGCEEWRFEGSAVECREQASAHRADVHPDLGKKRGRPRRAEIRSVEAPQAPEPPAHAALDNGSGTDSPALTGDTEGLDAAGNSDAPVDGTKKSGRGSVWTRELILEVIRAHAGAHGRLPKSDDWVKAAPGRPTASTVINHFGKWSLAIAAAASSSPPSVEVAKQEGAGAVLLAELLRRIADALDAGVFRTSEGLALVFDGLALETRKRAA